MDKTNMESLGGEESNEAIKEHWKNYTVGVMSASSNVNFAARENTKAIGRILAKNGFDGRNGGYSEGAMKDFADGFREECRERGLSDDEITEHLHGTIFSDKAIGEGLRNQRGVNDTMTIGQAHTLSERAGGIIDNSDAIIVAEGGIGTELEGLLAAQGEWFALKKNTQLKKEIDDAENKGILSEELKQKKLSEMVPVKPVIVIDSKQMFTDIVELAETRSPQTINTITEHIYVLTGHSNPNIEKATGELTAATLKNDAHATRQLEMILQYYYLLNLKNPTEEQETEKSNTQHALFDKSSEFLVQTLKERLASKHTFSDGGGI